MPNDATRRPQNDNRRLTLGRVLLIAVGLLFVGIGMVGVFVPLVPTFDFLLLALACFARSSPRLENWLLNHRFLGEPLRNWRRDRSMRLKHKIYSICAIWVSIGASIIILERGWVKGLLAVLAVTLTWYIATRKTAQPTEPCPLRPQPAERSATAD